MADARRILLVDDDQAYHELVSSHYLSGLGHELVSAYTVTEALEQISETWTVVLLDLNIPPYSGLESLRALRADAPNAPIVVLTARDISDLEVEAIRAGADSCVSKTGLSPQTLQHAVRCAVARHEQLTGRDRAAEVLSSVLVAITAVADMVAEREAQERICGPVDLLRALVTPETRKFAVETLREILFKIVIPAVAAGTVGGMVPTMLELVK